MGKTDPKPPVTSGRFLEIQIRSSASPPPSRTTLVHGVPLE
jgi:hypothetical protein